MSEPNVGDVPVTTPPADRPVIVWSTFPDEQSAAAAARRLVERRLAACVVRLPAVASTYRWQGEIEEGRETALLAKTRAGLADRVMAALAEDHPYQLPALLVLSVEAASRAYGAWIVAETGDPEDDVTSPPASVPAPPAGSP